MIGIYRCILNHINILSCVDYLEIIVCCAHTCIGRIKILYRARKKHLVQHFIWGGLLL